MTTERLTLSTQMQNSRKERHEGYIETKKSPKGHKTSTMATSFLVFGVSLSVFLLCRCGDIVLSELRGPLSHNPSIHTVKIHTSSPVHLLQG